MAGHYQDFLVPGMFEPCAQLLLDAADVKDGEAVLDVACGTGAVSRAAAARGASVVGVDMMASMLDAAREQGTDGIEYREGDAAALPVDDEAFDVALCQHGLQFFPDRPAAIAAMAKALKPGGTLAIACWSRFDDMPSFVATERALREHIGEAAAAGIRMPVSVSGDDIARLLDGLDDVSVADAPVTTAFAGDPAAMAGRFMLAGPLAPSFLGLSEADQAAFCAQIAEELVKHERDGVISPPMFTTIATARRPAG